MPTAAVHSFVGVPAGCMQEGSYDLRIQKIGSNYRAFKRTAMVW
jgi:hypothetical protein